MLRLNQDRALIFRITHVRNLAWILDHGLHCKNSAQQDPDFVTIGSPDLIAKRPSRCVPVHPGGTLADYVPFYFTPCSPMLYNIRTGYNGIAQWPMSDIVILVTSLYELNRREVIYLYTDRHAYLQSARFFDALGQLAEIDWGLLEARDFAYSPDDPGKMERYQAEALVYRHMPIDCLLGVVCYDVESEAGIKDLVEQRRPRLGVAVRPEWFYG